MNAADTRLCLLLHSIPELGDSALVRLLQHSGDPAAIRDYDSIQLRESGLTRPVAQALLRALASGHGGAGVNIDAQLQTLAALEAHVLPITDPRYPALLHTIYDPPPLLYVRGDVEALQAPQLAMVGSRRASPAGARAAGLLSAQAVQVGLTVCSGLALGIDGAAHRGALGAGGNSVAVMATGIDLIYPSRHRGLAGELVRSGCLVTEFPPGVSPLRYNFPRRNRLISGMSLGVLVVEAAQPSGSLITARTAMEQGREVFALPWSIFHGNGAGCLNLIRDGAKMVASFGDVLEELGSLYALQRDLFTDLGDQPVDSVSRDRSKGGLLALVGCDEISADELARFSGLTVAQVLAELSALEIDGQITRAPGGYIRS